MTTYFVSSVDGNDGDPGTSWAAAKQTVAGALTIPVVDGDIILVSHLHSYAPGAAITWTLATGRLAIISVNRAGSDAWLAGGTEDVGAANSGFTITPVNGSNLFMYGMTVKAGSNNNAACDMTLFQSATINSTFEAWSCGFSIPSVSTTAQLIIGVAATTNNYFHSSRFRDCTFTIGSRLGSAILFLDGIFEFINPTFAFGATKPAALFAGSGGVQQKVIVRDGDVSSFSGTAFFDVSTVYRLDALLKNLKLSATPTLTTGAYIAGSNPAITVRNCDSADTINIFSYVNAYGTLTVDATIYAANGALFNAAGLSWKIVTTAACNELNPFILPPIRYWGAAALQTMTHEIVQDNATALTDREVWHYVSYAGSASFPNYTYLTSRNANPLTGSASDLSTSTDTWTGTGGFSNPVKLKLSAAFTPSEVGIIESTIAVGKASATFYLDPKPKIATDTSATRWTDAGAFQEAAAAASGGPVILVNSGGLVG